MNTSRLADDLEQKFKRLNHYVARGSYSNTLAMGQAQNPILDTAAQPYLDLIPELESLAARIKEEVKTARESN